MDCTALEHDGVKFAKTAVICDQNGKYNEAVFYYKEAAQALIYAGMAGSKLEGIQDKVNEYLDRVQALHNAVQAQSSDPLKSKQQVDLERAHFLVTQAFEEDEKGNGDEAIELYTQAVELCIQTSHDTTDQGLQGKLKQLARQALDSKSGGQSSEPRSALHRHEEIEHVKINSIPSSLHGGGPERRGQNRPKAGPVSKQETIFSRWVIIDDSAIGQEWELLCFLLQQEENELTIDLHALTGWIPKRYRMHSDNQSSHQGRTPFRNASTKRFHGAMSYHQRQNGPVRPVQSSEPQGQRYTSEEIEVLRSTSKINSIPFVPFMSVDLKERFAFPVPFSDKLGKLALSPKQRTIFSRWVRPDEICNNPTMILSVSSFSIKQTVVSDCSFVASLAISAAYERRYNKKLITSIIYPQNRRGEPEYNPCGKYMVKLHINGVPRKVIIDDFLPCGQNGELLCSYSSNRNELWVSLIEKAYMKVMGGYDFPGSNSNIDLHALTGWIPERIAMHSDNQSFIKDDTFRMLYQRFHRGDVLITTATGVMTEEEGERWGLVPTHAYAVLDIREHKGKRFLQLKNPWSHLRWKGRFSERDEKNWTPELLKYLNFDPKTAQKFDNGVFWITFEDLCQYYDVIYLSWSPALFRESSCIHSTWDGKQGPVKDAYSLANNPQYRLEVTCPAGGTAVWVLLTRHITDKDDFAQNREFITLVVYKTEGKKVYYPADPPPYIDGIRINSPHYLTKMRLTSAGTHTFTLVVSQYEKQNTINYTLRVYSGCKFSFSKIPTPFTHTKRINGQWKGPSAGGCGNYKDSYKHNPIYQFNLERPGPMLIELRGSRQYSVGFEMVTVSTVVEPGPAGHPKKNSGDYRCGFCYMEADHVPAGIYNVIPTTFLPKQEGPFFLDFSSATSLKVSQLQ
ncbi:calpain-7 [Salvelinus sp. IW2-2015]|uniref:calpain-7 n=1 Tax=Salvelinus sp. IW2-2015 TaxID=2691554 RepID=UPI0038D37997